MNFMVPATPNLLLSCEELSCKEMLFGIPKKTSEKCRVLKVGFVYF